MHVHPPKPLHGWKEFANEIFVIVIGVLIALGFEQVVEQWHWRHEVADARETLQSEVGRNLLVMRLAHENAACGDANLDELVRRIKANDVAGVQAFLTMLPKLSGNSVLLRSTNWDTVKDSGLLTHMPPEEKRAFSGAYAVFGVEAHFAEIGGGLMNEALGEASVFEGDPDSRRALLKQIAVVRGYERSGNFPALIARIKRQTGIEPASPEAVQREVGLPLSPCTRFDQVAKKG